MKSHSCDFCRELVLNVPQWLLGELPITTFNTTQSIDEHASLGCNLAQVEFGNNHGCALMQLLRTQLQNEIDFSSENLASLRLETSCVITDAQWVLLFRIRTPDGVFTLRSVPKFYLCTSQGELHSNTS
jgi:hypothetical protein